MNVSLCIWPQLRSVNILRSDELDCFEKEIQEDRQYEGQDVLWLVVSDNEKVRWAAAQKYPSLVLTNTRKVSNEQQNLLDY